MAKSYDGQFTKSTPQASSVTGDTGIGHGETLVERRLREMAERRRKVAVGRVEASWLTEYAHLTASHFGFVAGRVRAVNVLHCFVFQPVRHLVAGHRSPSQRANRARRSCNKLRTIAAALRAPAVTGEAQDALPMSERTWTSKELVEAIQHGIATARMQWTCPHCERQSAPPAAGAPPALVALVDALIKAANRRKGLPHGVARVTAEYDEARAYEALLAWSPAPAQVAGGIAGNEGWKSAYSADGYGPPQPDAPAPVAPPAETPQLVDDAADLVGLVRRGIPRYLQNGGCSNCGGLPHTTTCLIGELQTWLDAYRREPAPPAEKIEVCLGCGRPTAERDCGCPAGTALVTSTVPTARTSGEPDPAYCAICYHPLDQCSHCSAPPAVAGGDAKLAPGEMPPSSTWGDLGRAVKCSRCDDDGQPCSHCEQEGQ